MFTVKPPLLKHSPACSKFFSGCRCGCGWLLKFAMDVFIIILMSYLYYFNQIAKNIDPLVLEVKR